MRLLLVFLLAFFSTTVLRASDLLRTKQALIAGFSIEPEQKLSGEEFTLALSNRKAQRFLPDVTWLGSPQASVLLLDRRLELSRIESPILFTDAQLRAKFEQAQDVRLEYER